MKKITHVRTPLMDSPETIAKIRAQWDARWTIESIAHEWGTTWLTIKTMSERLEWPDRGVIPRKTPSVWTPDLEERLGHLWASGMSGSQIAVEFGWGKEGKNKVISKVHRLNLPLRPDPIKNKKPPTKKPAPNKQPLAVGKALPPLIERPLPKAAPKPEFHAPIRTGGHIILETGKPRRFLADGPETDWPEPGKCQYPHGSGRPWRFCGNVAVNGSWCEKHFDIVYQKTRTEGYEPVRWIFR
jgi:hypothetical protein